MLSANYSSVNCAVVEIKHQDFTLLKRNLLTANGDSGKMCGCDNSLQQRAPEEKCPVVKFTEMQSPASKSPASKITRAASDVTKIHM